MTASQVSGLLNTQNTIVFDIESSKLEWWDGGAILGIALYFPDTDDSFYISEWDDLLDIFFQSGKTYIAHNIGFDIGYMLHNGFTVPEDITLIDTSVMLHLLNENDSTALKPAAEKYLGWPADEQEAMFDLIRERIGKPKAKANELMQYLELLTPEEVAPYAKSDAIKAWKLHQYLSPYIYEWGQEELLHETCNEYIPALIAVKRRGMLVDVKYLHDQLDYITDMHQESLTIFHDMVYAEINPNSPKQIRELLSTLDTSKYTLEGIYLGLVDKVLETGICPKCRGKKAKCKRCSGKGIIATKTKPYSDEEKAYARQIVECRKIQKQIGFVKGLIAAADEDNRIHSSLNVTGTVTGRLSSADPNLQNIPRPTKRFNLRKAFVAPEGYVFVEIDWKAQELRLGAHYAEEPTMAAILDADGDLHQHTADLLGVSRAAGKGANFSLSYGIGVEEAYRRWQAIDDMTLELAGKIVHGWHDQYPRIKRAYEYFQELAQQPRPTPNGTRKHRYIRLPLTGRVRHYSSLKPNQLWKTKDAWNFLIQGTGNELNRKLAQHANRLGIELIHLVHDSILCYIKEDELDETLDKILSFLDDPCVTGFYPRMGLDVKVGSSWGELHEYERT